MWGNVLIKTATIISSNGTFVGDCRVKEGAISELGELTTLPNEQIIDASGLHLLPGVIDPQVHFREPGQNELETLESGSMAAASGGVTSFLDMPNNRPAATSLATIEAKLESAAATCVVNYGFFIGASADNLAELQQAVGRPGEPLYHPGVCGIKIFMGSSTGDLLVDDERDLQRIFAGTCGLIAVHAEDEQRLNDRFEALKHRTDMAAHAEWRDSETALLATRLACRLARMHKRRLHILHLTSALEADWLTGRTRLKAETADDEHITTETLPQHLTFDQEDVEKEGTRLKMNPPIRYSNDRETLWKRLHDGTIQCIATDHAPQTLESKSRGWPDAPSGMPGVETSLAVMLSHAKAGRCSLEQVVSWMSTNVADIYGLTGKGRIEVGADGDLVLVDMSNSMLVEDANCWSRVAWNPFRGRELVGWPMKTLVAGRVVFERDIHSEPKGRILVKAGETGAALKFHPT